MSESLSNKEIQAYREKMEQLIDKCGHFIQVVSCGSGTFGYTIGRTDENKNEFYMRIGLAPYNGLLNSVPRIYDKGNIHIGVPFVLDEWTSKATGEKTLFVLDYATNDQQKDMLGAFSRAERKQQSILPPLQIIIADQFNRLPDKYAAI